MAREQTIPSTSTFIQDFGLNVTAPPVQRNKRVVIIGTSEDGPMYEPVLVDQPEDAEYAWGRMNAGDLVRGIFECWNVQTGYPTVVGVRIGNGVQASLTLKESSGAGVNAPQSADSLKLTARYPGQIYNQITIGYDDNRAVSIYNPKTGLASTFTVDTEYPNNANAQAHNVSELVNVINADRNLAQVLQASYTPLISDYEIAISGTSFGVDNEQSSVTLSLQDILVSGYVTLSGFMVQDNPLGTGLTAANNLVGLTTIQSVSFSEWEDLENKGLNNINLKFMPLDGKGQSRWHTIQCMQDYNNDNLYTTDPSGFVKSEFIYSLSNALVDGGGGYGGPTAASGLAGNQFAVQTPICLDDTEEASNSGVASGYIYSLSATTYAHYSGVWTKATCQGIDTKEDATATLVRPSGVISVFISDSSDINGFWQELPYSTNSGVYLKSFASGVAYFGIGSGVAGQDTVMRHLVDVSGYILPNKYILVTANTVKGFLTEVQTLSALPTTNKLPTTYFVAGQKVTFDAISPYNMIVNYGTQTTYEPGASVAITDLNNGYIQFSTSGNLPGPGGGPLSNSKVSYIRLNYTYQPQWPNISSMAQALAGGTNGNAMSNADRAAQLKIATDKLRNYEADIWVPMSCFIDSTSEQFNPVTGLKETIPTAFHTVMEDFLDDLSINSLQPMAVLGVTPMGTITQANKDNWVNKLTVTDLSDPLRGANIMSLIQNKFISVVAFEPIFMNIGRGQPYTANGQAIYAGVIASLPYDISPTNKTLQNVNNIRFDLAVSQNEALNSMRYVVMKTRPGRAPVIVEDVTAAPFGSDFVNWSTYSITAEAANRVKMVANEFIGRPNSVEVRTSLEQLISNALMSMTGLRAFDFNLTSTPTQQVLGIIEVDLILVPIFQIKKIRTTVKLRKNLPTSGA